jgi:hypothetical protein
MTDSVILTHENYRSYQETIIAPIPQKAAGNLTLQQFFVLLYYILDVEQPDLIIAPAYPRYLMPETKEYEATMENPTERFKDTITFKVTREEPGAIGGDKQPFGSGGRELYPRLREVQTGTDKSKNIYGQWFDTLVQFDVWSVTNYEADQLALWFRRFMTAYRNFFRQMGLGEVLFWWRGQDDVTSKLRNSLSYRTLVYFIRSEEISTDEDFVLKEIEVLLENRVN